MLKNNKAYKSVTIDTMDFPGGSVIKNLPANAGDATDASSISGSGRSLGEEMLNLVFLCSCLGNPMDRGA